MNDIWDIYAKEQEIKKAKEISELANKTPCDNCGQKPAYSHDTTTGISVELKSEYCGFKANLCADCYFKFCKKAYYHYDWED